MPEMVNLVSFRMPEGCGLTVLPGRSILIRQKLVKNAKIEKVEFLVIFKQCLTT